MAAATREKNKFRKNTADTFWFKYCLSCTAATVAEAVTYPLDLTKTRLQIQGEHGLNGEIAAVRRGVVGTAAGIVREEGILKMWQGVTPAFCRHFVYTGCRMGFYEILREQILGKNADGTFPVWKAVLGGLTAGALGQFLASPADLVKVQMQMEGKRRLEGKPPRVKSAWHAFRKILQQGGIKGLWKGWVPNVQRAALVNMGDLATYDSAKHFILRNTQLDDNYITHTLSSACSGLVAATLGTPADVIKTRVMNQPVDKNTGSACSGMVSASLSTPLDVVKTRIMNQPTDVHSRGLLYKGSVDCLMKTINKEGFFALYKGFIPIWARMAPWSLTFWLSYEEIRRIAGTSSF